MLIKNGWVFTDRNTFRKLDVEIQDGVISNIFEPGGTTDSEVIDAEGRYVLPGLVDIHIHACAGRDFCEGTEQAIETMAEYLGAHGVTSFVAASMAFDEPKLERVFKTARRVIEGPQSGRAKLYGINMEGPFFSKAKKGAQSEKYIIDPSIGVFDRLFEASGSNIKLLDIAPELPGASELIKHACGKTTVSIAHTTADYETAVNAFKAGATHVTHLFNAMPAFAHRAPGVVGAASDMGATVELICDGIHIHPAVVRSVFRWFGDDRVVLISDAMMACGMLDGSYELGGQKVIVKDGKATLEDGTIAGSSTDLHTCLKRAVEFGVPIESAVKAATINPAKVARIDSKVGSITPGKRADLIILNSSLDIERVLIAP
jgi:N-acetylglucosamine-6-phosphate deacetylase